MVAVEDALAVKFRNADELSASRHAAVVTAVESGNRETLLNPRKERNGRMAVAD